MGWLKNFELLSHYIQNKEHIFLKGMAIKQVCRFKLSVNFFKSAYFEVSIC